jgi:exosome complex RNA-binding protein Rrp4
MDHNNDRNVVVPGDLLSDDPKSRAGHLRKDGKVRSLLYGMASSYKDRCE